VLRLGTSIAELRERNRPLRRFTYQRLPATATERGLAGDGLAWLRDLIKATASS